MIVGEHSRENDLDVNPVRAKKLTNMRATATDDSAVRLSPPRILSLEEAISYIKRACKSLSFSFLCHWSGVDADTSRAAGEVCEVTPRSIRLRKGEMDVSKRRAELRRASR